MKVSGKGGVSQSAGAKPTRGAGAGGGFQVTGAPPPAAPTQVSSAAGVSSVMGVGALLALQDVESATERRRRSLNRAGRLLDHLDGLKAGLLAGELSRSQLDNLARAVREQRTATDDPQLEAVLDEIETRASVELAKLEVVSRAD